MYGFLDGHFSLTATAKGVSALQAGRAVSGHVDTQGYRNYMYRNTDPTATLVFTLNEVYGDPDLFVRTFLPTSGDEKPVFPTQVSTPISNL